MAYCSYRNTTYSYFASKNEFLPCRFVVRCRAGRGACMRYIRRTLTWKSNCATQERQHNMIGNTQTSKPVLARNLHRPRGYWSHLYLQKQENNTGNIEVSWITCQVVAYRRLHKIKPPRWRHSGPETYHQGWYLTLHDIGKMDNNRFFFRTSLTSYFFSRDTF